MLVPHILSLIGGWKEIEVSHSTNYLYCGGILETQAKA